MKHSIKMKKLFVPLIFAFLVLTQGCGERQPDFKPISGGFGVVTKWVGVDSGPGAALFYKGNESKPVLIWPFLGLNEEPMLFTNDMAFFVGDIPDNQGRFGDAVYIAVQAPGPALDVSEDILKLWAESKKLDFEKMRGQYAPLELKAVPDGIEVHYLGDENLPATFAMSWQQVSNLIQDVKRTGKEHAFAKPHMIYLKNDYGPEKRYEMPIYRNTNYFR
jgi:hypothetical protein